MGLWEGLSKNTYAMNMLRDNADKGRMRLSDIFSDWELGIGALQSKTIRRFLDFHKKETEVKSKSNNNENEDKKDSAEDTEKESAKVQANGGSANENNAEKE